MYEFMNPPMDYEYTNIDIINDYIKYRDEKKVAAIYLITTKEVKSIIKSAGL